VLRHLAGDAAGFQPCAVPSVLAHGDTTWCVSSMELDDSYASAIVVFLRFLSDYAFLGLAHMSLIHGSPRK